MKDDAQERGFGDIAKSALGGLATFGAEMGRLAGKGAKSAWKGARRVGGKAKVTAAEKASVAREKAAEKASVAREKASESASVAREKASEKASEIREKASEKASEMKERRAADIVE
jgi:hypothetical protein